MYHKILKDKIARNVQIFRMVMVNHHNHIVDRKKTDVLCECVCKTKKKLKTLNFSNMRTCVYA